MTNDLLTVPEVAEYLRLSPGTIYRLASQRKIPRTKVAGKLAFRRGEIDAWLDASSTPAELAYSGRR